jgi:hypothetical protein
MKLPSLSLILLFAFFPVAAANGPGTRTKRPLLADKPVSIHQIKQEKGKRGSYQTTGYVVNSYTCPPCPPRAECKPCMMRTNIVISEDNKTLHTYQLTDKDLIVFTKDAPVFQAGKKYIFSIKVTGEKTTSEPLNDVDLVEYKPLK